MAALKIMYQKNLYKYTVINYTQNPPSLGGNWEVGTETSVCFSRSPKKAMAFEGAVTERYEGVMGCPVLRSRTLSKGGKILFDIMD